MPRGPKPYIPHLDPRNKELEEQRRLSEALQVEMNLQAIRNRKANKERMEQLKRDRIKALTEAHDLARAQLFSIGLKVAVASDPAKPFNTYYDGPVSTNDPIGAYVTLDVYSDGVNPANTRPAIFNTKSGLKAFFTRESWVEWANNGSAAVLEVEIVSVSKSKKSILVKPTKLYEALDKVA